MLTVIRTIRIGAIACILGVATIWKCLTPDMLVANFLNMTLVANIWVLTLKECEKPRIFTDALCTKVFGFAIAANMLLMLVSAAAFVRIGMYSDLTFAGYFVAVFAVNLFMVVFLICRTWRMIELYA